MVHLYPENDRDFAHAVEEVITDSYRHPVRRETLLDQVRRRLAERYPAASIHPRDPLAANGESSELWYCYRDGRMFVRPSEE
jgi:hypothetical protein